MRNQQEIKNEEKILEEELGLRTFFFVTIGVITIWGAFWYFIKDWEDRGTFGDMFGAINALFSGLALAGIIYTMLLQKQELRLQRLELKANREELARTATAQEGQVDSQKVIVKLNALNTLVSYHLENIKRAKEARIFVEEEWQSVKKYTDEIRSILAEKNKGGLGK